MDENLRDALFKMQARISRLETTLMALVKAEAADKGLPPKFSEMLTGDAWLHSDGVQNETFRAHYDPEMKRWVELFGSFPHRPES